MQMLDKTKLFGGQISSTFGPEGGNTWNRRPNRLGDEGTRKMIGARDKIIGSHETKLFGGQISSTFSVEGGKYMESKIESPQRRRNGKNDRSSRQDHQIT
jgi:hypothetical protein